jgi:hypothetical protein
MINYVMRYNTAGQIVLRIHKTPIYVIYVISYRLYTHQMGQMHIYSCGYIHMIILSTYTAIQLLKSVDACTVSFIKDVLYCFKCVWCGVWCWLTILLKCYQNMYLI